jgi:hypothetical protein
VNADRFDIRFTTSFAVPIGGAGAASVSDPARTGYSREVGGHAGG